MKYSEKLLTHFYHPKNVGTFPSSEKGVGRGTVGNYENGIIIHFEIKIEKNKVSGAKFKAYGSCPVIAACSYAAEWLQGKSVEQVHQLSSTIIIKELAIPDLKVHSALMVIEAINAALNADIFAQN